MKTFFSVALLATTVFIAGPTLAQDVVVTGNASVVQPVFQTVPVIIQQVPVFVQQPVVVVSSPCYRPNVVYIGQSYSSPYYSSYAATRGYFGQRYASCSPNVVYFGRGEARVRGSRFTHCR